MEQEEKLTPVDDQAVEEGLKDTGPEKEEKIIPQEEDKVKDFHQEQFCSYLLCEHEEVGHFSILFIFKLN